MERLCFVCNKKSINWSENLRKTKSKHSQTSISVFLQKSVDLGDYVLRRDLNDELNCICAVCLSKIHAYDWTCIKVKEQELELQTMLISTDKFFSYQTETVFVDDCGSLDDCKDTVLSEADVKVEVKSEVLTQTTSVASSAPTAPATVLPERTTLPTKPSDAIKRSKPIIVRVVKRVPFLGSKPTIPVPTNSVVKPVEVVKQVAKPTVKNEVKPTYKLVYKLPKAPSKMSITTKPSPKAIKRQTKKPIPREPPKIVVPRVICQYCDNVHENETALEVIFDFFSHRNLVLI